jgi:hypothetical protein
MEMEIDQEMTCRCYDKGCNPVIFVPDVNFSRLEEPNIINAF